MTSTDTRIERQAWKQRHEALFRERDFVTQHVVPLVPELASNWSPQDWGLEIVRAKATDRMTLRYSFGSSVEIYGKAYFDDSTGRDAHQWLVHFWQRGFDAGSGLETPEPLGIVAKANLLLMRRAEGMPLSNLAAARTIEKALQGARLAARWLVKYQAAEIPGLSEESPCEKIEVLKIADALAKVAAERPEYSTLLIGMLHELRAVAPRDNSSPRTVLLHGQFRPAHVFVDGERLTVIDIEKLCLSDPAKDVARFVHVLKKSSLESGGDTECADRVAEEFVAEYQRLSPLNLENLGYFRALLALKAFGKILKSRKTEESVRRVIGEKYRAEFEAATSERAVRGFAPYGCAGNHRGSTQEKNKMGAFAQDNFHSPERPLPPAANSASPFGKEALAQKALEISTPEFIESRIVPLVRATLNGHGTSCVAEVVQNTGTGRLTLRYDFGLENVLFAKLYVDELGSWCSEVNRALWSAGFNGTGRYRVPEPVGFLSDHKLLLMRSVPGKALGAAFDGDTTVDLVDGSREAAEWLAILHRTSLRMGAPDRDWDLLKLFRMASRLIKAVALHPEKLDMVRELMDLLEQRAARLPANRAFVFTHGRYHHDHIFLSAEATGVIDLDRCRPSDPAKDAAEFVRVFRLTAFKEGFDMGLADQATTAFLDTYLAKVPEAASSLGCYWAIYVFHSLLGGIKKVRSKGKKSWEELIEFYVSEIMHALDFGR